MHGYTFEEVGRMTLDQLLFLMAGLKRYYGGGKRPRLRGALKSFRTLLPLS